MKTVKIVDATDAQLREFGRDVLQLPMPPNCKRETLEAKISAAWNKDEIPVSEAPADNSVAPEGQKPEPVSTAQQDGNNEDDPMERKVKIQINASEAPGGDQPVPLSVNGVAILVPRDEVVEIKEKYVQVLEAAVQDKYDVDEDGNIIPTPRKVKRYPFQRVAAA